MNFCWSRRKSTRFTPFAFFEGLPATNEWRLRFFFGGSSGESSVVAALASTTFKTETFVGGGLSNASASAISFV